jgi:hypothetical protein
MGFLLRIPMRAFGVVFHTEHATATENLKMLVAEREEFPIKGSNVVDGYICTDTTLPVIIKEQGLASGR